MIHFTNIFTHNKHKKNAFKSFFETDSEGRVIIPIGAEKIENFMSLFSINEYRVLSNDIYDNVGRIVDNLPINSKIAVHIKTSLPVSDEKKQELVESFKHNYLMKSIQTENTKRYNLIISSICYGAGILVFLLLLLLSIFAYHPGGEEKFIGAEVIWEIISIVGWVFIWEATDRLFFYMPSLSLSQSHSYSLYHAKFVFIKEKPTEVSKEIVQAKEMNNNLFNIIPALTKITNKEEKIAAKIESKNKVLEKKLEETENKSKT